MPGPAEQVESLLDGGWIERYHIKGQRMLTRQSVAEHSWRMSAIVFAVNPQLSANVLWALLFHDVSERVTGDVPANVKRANPEIERVINEVSTNEEIRLGIRFNLTAEEQKLLSWADRFEGALHCLDELEMGNHKILATLHRYIAYSLDDKYKLADNNHESNRRALVGHFNQRLAKEL